MNKQEIFDAWAPAAVVWARWVKPVLFSQLDLVAVDDEFVTDVPIDLNWAIDPHHSIAIVADLPGASGISLSLQLATIGYRPIPLYNACPDPSGDAAIVNVKPILLSLATAASILDKISLPNDAPPAFLLDINRNPATDPLPGQFDNRSISLPTDFPSANLLVSNGVRRVILVQSHHADPQTDLSHTLLRWQEAGLEVVEFTLAEPNVLLPIIIQRPKAFRILWYNLLAKFGLKKSPLGGFEGRLPMPSSG